MCNRHFKRFHKSINLQTWSEHLRTKLLRELQNYDWDEHHRMDTTQFWPGDDFCAKLIFIIIVAAGANFLGWYAVVVIMILNAVKEPTIKLNKDANLA